MSVDDGLKMIISGGMITPKYIPPTMADLAEDAPKE